MFHRSRSPGDRAGMQPFPSSLIFSAKNFLIESGLRRALVSWNKKVLFAEPPPFVTKRNLYSSPSTAARSSCAGRFEPVFFSSYMLDRCQLAVAKIRLGIGVIDSPRERLFVIARHPYVLTFLGDDDRGPSVLTRRAESCQPRCWRSSSVRARRSGRCPKPRNLRESFASCAR